MLISAEVVLDGLLVAYVDQYLFKDSETAGFIYRNGKTALEHILQQSGRLQAYRFSSGVRAGDQDDPLIFVDFYIQGNEGFARAFQA